MKCKRPDCNQPRMVQASGRELTYCEEHQREYWREISQRNRDAKKPPTTLVGSIGDNGTTIEREYAEVRGKTSRLSAAEQQAIIDRLKERFEAPAPATPILKVEESPAGAGSPFRVIPGQPLTCDNERVGGEPISREQVEQIVNGVHPPHECNNCLYRDIVELLEKRVPGVREMVDGLKTISRQ